MRTERQRTENKHVDAKSKFQRKNFIKNEFQTYKSQNTRVFVVATEAATIERYIKRV